ncbi:DUF2304 domain-containing protein [Kocuria rhizophila]|uniref:DUF2304 domain-containing protein n=1 Tax=Kocuria rhizophila (strain ATCC 9341 / DSM 348 / NBRC 103217 / DC2201) TaxID=378753 RepID=B2GLF7_KOCRD|nr:DUF2304 domain-containing protein [Kocuria rhizophila]ASE10814.1 DUF2304 domain-containing protein [Kocuria rhizophila]BAG29250.1 hypothetical protein KRH_09030 [Kocuria rhizophila DC2201]VEH75469.1 Uncharacterized conserved protein [Kocuria rhizophila]
MTIVVQIVLILAVAYGALTLVRGGANAKHQAIRRLAAVAFFLFAAVSILVPDLVTQVARALGIGRGTDLVLYALVVLFMVTQYTSAQRRRVEETNVTRLARHIAIAEAEKPWEHDAAHAQRPSVLTFAAASPIARPADVPQEGPADSTGDAARGGSTAI